MNKVKISDRRKPEAHIAPIRSQYHSAFIIVMLLCTIQLTAGVVGGLECAASGEDGAMISII